MRRDICLICHCRTRSRSLHNGMRRAASLIFLLGASACSSDTASQQQARGEAAYIQYCQMCHEPDQEGIGPLLPPAVLASRKTAVQLYDYNRNNMPYNAGRTLTDRQYWDITAFLLWRSGLRTGDQPLTARNADFTLTPE